MGFEEKKFGREEGYSEKEFLEMYRIAVDELKEGLRKHDAIMKLIDQLEHGGYTGSKSNLFRQLRENGNEIERHAAVLKELSLRDPRAKKQVDVLLHEAFENVRRRNEQHDDKKENED